MYNCCVLWLNSSDHDMAPAQMHWWLLLILLEVLVLFAKQQ
jgi:hypothetical protein